MPPTAPKKLAQSVRDGDRRSIAQAITLIESTRPGDRDQANELMDYLIPHAGQSIRLGISGVPGVGKSTFIESFGNHLIRQGHRVAVLAVDPTSAISGGSILGDKTRMETLSRDPNAFVRPSPAGHTLGGVTRHTRETINIVEAAGFDVVIVETVGVGQSETAVAEMTDMFVLLLLPGGGDELQGIKRGIVELADLIVVNKADGAMASVANHSAADYLGALRFLRPRHPDWTVPVETCSALENVGIEAIWDIVERYRTTMIANGEFEKTRTAQATAWLWHEAAEILLALLRQDAGVGGQTADLETAVAAGTTSPGVAAEKLVRQFLNGIKS